jgi:hypothetical protein
MTITPDTKDWTWVLQRRCPECGFDAQSFPRESVGTQLRDNAAAWRDVLASSGVRDRPRPDRWSPLEYGCHVRDVCLLYEQRLALMLTQDNPQFANWDQDATAAEDRYSEQDPATVDVQLHAAAEALATSFDQVTGLEWQRTGDRSDGVHFTVESFARYFLHDPVHHLYDVTGLRQHR